MLGQRVTYRVMVEGEDHTLFCFANPVPLNKLVATIIEAKEAYPCGRVFYEHISHGEENI